MKVVILGADLRGLQIAKHLIEDKENVVIIEPDPKKADGARTQLDCIVFNGSGTSIEDLEEAGLEEADVFIGMSDSDEVNIVACGIVSSNFKVETKIASIRNLTYFGSEGLSGGIPGIDCIVNPEAEAARAIFESIDKGAFSDIITFHKTDLQLHNIKVTEGAKIARKHINSIRKYMDNYSFLVAVINRDREVFIPDGDTVVLPGDVISIVSEERGLAKFLKGAGIEGMRLRKILLVGGSNTARFLLKHFAAGERRDIALVDSDPDVCKTFARQFPEILTIKADITDDSLFEDENLASYDLIVSLTANDALNILTTIFAKRIGVGRGIALVKRNNNYLRLTPYLDIDATFAMSHSTVNSVLRFIRGGGGLSTSYTLFGGKVIVLELTIREGSPVAGKKIKSIRMKRKGLISGITRGGSNFIPTGETELMQGDVILVIAERNSYRDVLKLFSIG